jgi:hypothetical protein
MRSGGSSQLLPFMIVLGFVGWAVYRRTRPQQVRLTRTIVYTSLIVLLSLVGLGANTRLLTNSLFIDIAPVALLSGLAVGWLMMRTIRFWRDQSNGQVWMSGGAAYVAIWLVTMALRLGIDYAATGGFSSVSSQQGNQAPTTLSIIASDLLFLSIGLWLARGYALVRRYREFAPVGTDAP